ncbi:four helix bundle protein [Hydrogenimonas urashimensis]|uniref:four helix bundle protein n=1 Tax=Hydrogenimonas urashimensis TaxID=2740515 RepID=UPI001F3F2969|nr:four helix bundle protein [Hydrogenimonas urashimensis]
MMKCESLDVWKKADALSAENYVVFRDLKNFGFKDQITRSGLSIPSNIAEGLERNSDKESWRFLDIALGSAAELKTQIYIGMKINYIELEKGKGGIRELESIGRMINGLRRSLEKKTNDQRPTTNDPSEKDVHA